MNSIDEVNYLRYQRESLQFQLSMTNNEKEKQTLGKRITELTLKITKLVNNL